MTYELEELNNIIYSELKKFIESNAILESEDFDYWVSKIEKESSRLKNTFIRVAFGYTDERQIEKYMGLHQVELIRLTDRLLHYTNDELKKPSRPAHKYTTSHLLNRIYVFLEDLINYLENHFSQYFNVDATVLQSYKLIAIRDFRDRLKGLNRLCEVNNIDQSLINIILYPLIELVNDNEKHDLSYRKLMYYKKFIKEMEDYLQTTTMNEDHTTRLISSMIYINYNSYKFFAYCTENIKDQYQKKETLTDQIDKLALTSKVINQTQQKPGVAYRPERESLKFTLIAWIDEEIGFLEKRHQLTFNMSVGKAVVANDFKLITSLSVAQLAYFVRLLIEEKVILNKNQREVLKFIAQNTRTKKAENVSSESLRTRYYNVDTSTREALKDMVINLLNHIRKKSKKI